MRSLIKSICKTINFLYHLFLIFSCCVLLAIVLIISAQVIARQLFQSSIRWSQEVALLLMVWMAFITCAVGVERNLHIGIELFFQFLPNAVQSIINMINRILVIFTGLCFLIYGTKQSISTAHSIMPSTGWPKSIMYIIIPLSGFFIIYFGLLKLFHQNELMPAPIFFEKEETELD